MIIIIFSIVCDVGLVVVRFLVTKYVRFVLWHTFKIC